MSAFVVQYGVIDDVVTAMGKTGDQADDFGRALLAMNISAVAQRYQLQPDCDEMKEYAQHMGEYEYVKPGTSAVQKFKSLGCLTYQCSEGNVPETKLFKQCEEEMERSLSAKQQASYSAAAWDRDR